MNFNISKMLRLTFSVILLTSLSVVGCGKKDSSQPKSMLTEDLKCPENSVSKITRWGGIDENGWAHSCKMRHGKYHVWRDNILAIEGQYNQGKKEGEWKYRDKNGEIIKMIIYKNGTKDSEKKLN